MRIDPAQPLEPFTPAHAAFLAQLSDSEFWSHATEIAHRLTAITNRISPEDGANDYLLCELAQGYCLLPFASLHEVLATPTHFTHLPLAPSWMLGLMAWRDEAVAVVDLPAYLLSPSPPLPLPTSSSVLATLPAHTLFENRRIAIASHGDITVGLQVSPIHLPLHAINRVSTEMNEEIGLATLERVQYQEVIAAMFQGALVLHVEALVAHIAQQLEIVSPNE